MKLNFDLTKSTSFSKTIHFRKGVAVCNAVLFTLLAK